LESSRRGRLRRSEDGGWRSEDIGEKTEDGGVRADVRPTAAGLGLVAGTGWLESGSGL